MNIPFYIAKRYAVSFSKNTAINIITIIASAGIVASAMALFVVLSVFSGLRDFSMSFVNATDPDFRIEPQKGKSILLREDELQKLQKITEIESFSKVVEERVLFFFNDKEHVAHIKGVDENYTKVSSLHQHLYAGNWLQSRSAEVVVGAEISRKLGLGLFDYNNSLRVYSPKAGSKLIENQEDAFITAHLVPVGIYNINEEIDAKYVYCHYILAQQLLQFQPNQVSALEIRKKSNASETEVIQKLKSVFGNSAIIKTRLQLNDTLYRMLNTENIAVYLIFTLVIIIALFNLVGALIMMIIDKKSNQKTLLSLGASLPEIRRIFLFQGLLLTVFGGIIGIILGVILVVLQQRFELLMITPTLPYPVIFEVKNLVLVIATLLVLGFLASWIASRKVNVE